MNELSFHISDNAAKRIAHLASSEADGAKLRVSVLGGGCSGFQYNFEFDTAAPSDDDRVFSNGNAEVVVDSMSLTMLNESTLDFLETLGSSAFSITNPQAAASCGCGNSFAIM